MVKAISIISWMEVMVGTNEHTESEIKNWLSRTFDIIELNKLISELAINIRNTKDFEDTEPGIRVPYKL